MAMVLSAAMMCRYSLNLPQASSLAPTHGCCSGSCTSHYLMHAASTPTCKVSWGVPGAQLHDARHWTPLLVSL